MTQVQSQQNNALYQNMDLWRAKHEINTNRYAQQLDLNQSTFDNVRQDYQENPSNDKLDFLNYLNEDLDKIDSEYQSTREEIGLDFDFMEGKDPQNEDEYRAQVLKLAQGEIEAKDIDGDGKLSAEEYALSELNDLEKYGSYSEEDVQETIYTSLYIFDILDKKLESSDDDGYLSEDELADFNTHLDEYQGDESTVRDGKFNIDSAVEYTKYLLEQVKEQADDDSLINTITIE